MFPKRKRTGEGKLPDIRNFFGKENVSLYVVRVCINELNVSIWIKYVMIFVYYYYLLLFGPFYVVLMGFFGGFHVLIALVFKTRHFWFNLRTKCSHFYIRAQGITEGHCNDMICVINSTC